MFSVRKLVRRILGRIDSEWAIRINRDNDRIQELLPRILKNDSNCIDVGSHNGAYIRHFLSLSPMGSHIAIEPLPEHFISLRKKFPTVQTYNVALSDFEGSATFYIPEGVEAMSGLKRQNYPSAVHPRKINVEVRKLDLLVNPSRRWALIKIDVEGAELGVLRGAEELIRNSHPTIIFEYAKLHAEPYKTTPEELYTFFDSRGYDILRLDRKQRYSLDEFKAMYEEAHESGYDRNAETNFLAVFRN